MSGTEPLEALLAASEARYRALLDQLPLPTFVYDVETLRFLEANQAALDLYGYSRDEFRAMRLTDIRPRSEISRLLATLDRQDPATRSYGVWTHLRKDGTQIEMEIVSRDTADDGGRTRLVIATDVTAPRKLERALREEEQRFRAAFQTVPDAMSIGRLEDGVNVAVNENYCKLSGWAEEEAVGATSVQLGLWVNLAERERLFEGLRAAGAVRDLEVTFRRRDGSHFIASLASRVFSAGGRQYFLTVSRDITDRKQAERARHAIYRIAEEASASGTLQEMLAAVHAIVAELMPAPNLYIALLDAEHQRLEFPYYVDERDAPPAGPVPLGRGLTEYVLRTGQPLVVSDHAAFAALVARGEVESVGEPSTSWIGVPLRTKDRTVGVLAAQMYDGDERYGERHTELLTFVSTQIARAIERKQDEEALRASERRFRALIGNSSDGIVVVSRDGTVLYRSGAAAHILGEAASAPGTKPMDLVHPEDRASVFASIQQALANPGVPVTIRSRFRRADGAWREIETVATNLLDDPSVRGIVSNFRDVTERRQMEARLMVADRMVSIGTLAAGVAHEINNPLAYVLANLDYVAGKLPAVDGEVRRALADAQVGANRVRTIVRDLKTFSRGDDERVGPVDLTAVLEASANMAWNEVRHRARLTKDFAHALPLVVGNESRLGQVFLNLLVNAAQSIPEGAADRNLIRVCAHAEGDRVVVDVHDSGSGIPQENLARLFDPFFTTKPVGVGTGLGLFICQNIVTALGGDITVNSEVGKGTTVHVSLPVATEVATRAADESPTQVAPRARILVIDDEPLIGSTLIRSLGEHDVVADTSAKAALARIRDGARFDLILCDVMMPEMTGVGFYDALKQDAPDAAQRVVFMSGGAFTAAAQEFLDRVENPRLDKPLDLGEVRALIAARLAVA